MEVTDQDVLEKFPDTRLDVDNFETYRGLLQRRLLVNRCRQCATWHTPPRSICPKCWSTDVVATEVSGRGTVFLLVFLHQGPPGVDYTGGYPLAVIELEEQPGLRVVSTLVGFAREDMTVGQTVGLLWGERDGNPYPVFGPASATTEEN